VARPPAVLGLDLGTSQLKALLCAADGTVLGRGVAGYQVSTPRDGWAETDPEQWWRAARTAVRSAVGPARAEVSGLAVVGQMHGLILCSERTEVLRPAIVWLDRRAEAEVADYQRLPADLRARLGNAPSAGMAGPILLWLARNEPAASLLAAALSEGWGLLTLGTGGQWIIPAAKTPVATSRDLDAGTNLFRSVDGGTFRLAGAQNVGVTLDWVRRTLGASWEELYRTAARPWRPASTPVFLPYLAGERWEHREGGGAWTGLALAHQRDDLMHAALEGVAFLLRGQLDDLRAAGSAPAKIMLAGGGSRPPAWRQLLADVLAVPLYPAADPATGWLTARGAALIAARAAGIMTEAGEPGRSDPISKAVEPRSPELAEQAYREFRSVRACRQTK